MKNFAAKQIIFLSLILFAPLSFAKPPFDGTLFIAPNIITDNDPTSFISLEYKGHGMRSVYDRRINGWSQIDAHLFLAKFDDNKTIEVQANPEFTKQQAEAESNKYLKVIGQLPYSLRDKVQTIWLHKGMELFGGGNNNLLIHTGRGEEYIADGILAEAFMHEAVHTSLDDTHKNNSGWLEAQRNDGKFISKYAEKSPDREDLAESFVTYFALRYKENRISSKLRETISTTIPNRIRYFDSMNLDMHPVRDLLKIHEKKQNRIGQGGL